MLGGCRGWGGLILRAMLPCRSVHCSVIRSISLSLGIRRKYLVGGVPRSKPCACLIGGGEKPADRGDDALKTGRTRLGEWAGRKSRVGKGDAHPYKTKYLAAGRGDHTQLYSGDFLWPKKRQQVKKRKSCFSLERNFNQEPGGSR